MPVTTKVIVLFLQFMARSVSSFKYLRNVLSSIRQLHYWTGWPYTCDQMPLLTLHCWVCVKMLGDSVLQKLPITPRILRGILTQLDFSNSLHICLWAVLTVGFFSFF